MPRQKKIIEIVCFYCEKKFKYIVSSHCQINRAYCGGCEKTHLGNKYHGGLGYRKYLEYLNQIRSRFGRSRKAIEGDEVNLWCKEGRLFKGGIDLGRIVASDKLFVYVQKYPLSGSICSYQRKFIEKL